MVKYVKWEKNRQGSLNLFKPFVANYATNGYDVLTAESGSRNNCLSFLSVLFSKLTYSERNTTLSKQRRNNTVVNLSWTNEKATTKGLRMFAFLSKQQTTIKIVLGLIRSVCFDNRLEIANGFMSKSVFFRGFHFSIFVLLFCFLNPSNFNLNRFGR